MLGKEFNGSTALIYEVTKFSSMTSVEAHTVLYIIHSTTQSEVVLPIKHELLLRLIKELLNVRR